MTIEKMIGVLRANPWEDPSEPTTGDIADKLAELRAFAREVAAIDPLCGGGDAKYFVTADFVVRARTLVE